jgi:hypothetical protein
MIFNEFEQGNNEFDEVGVRKPEVKIVKIENEEIPSGN